MAAPISIVLTGVGDVAGKVSRLRCGNGGVLAGQRNCEGTGNYGNYSINIGRRGGTSIPSTAASTASSSEALPSLSATIAKVKRCLEQEKRSTTDDYPHRKSPGRVHCLQSGSWVTGAYDTEEAARLAVSIEPGRTCRAVAKRPDARS